MLRQFHKKGGIIQINGIELIKLILFFIVLITFVVAITRSCDLNRKTAFKQQDQETFARIYTYADELREEDELKKLPLEVSQDVKIVAYRRCTPGDRAGIDCYTRPSLCLEHATNDKIAPFCLAFTSDDKEVIDVAEVNNQPIVVKGGSQIMVSKTLVKEAEKKHYVIQFEGFDPSVFAQQSISLAKKRAERLKARAKQQLPVAVNLGKEKRKICEKDDQGIVLTECEAFDTSEPSTCCYPDEYCVNAKCYEIPEVNDDCKADEQGYATTRCPEEGDPFSCCTLNQRCDGSVCQDPLTPCEIMEGNCLALDSYPSDPEAFSACRWETHGLTKQGCDQKGFCCLERLQECVLPPDGSSKQEYLDMIEHMDTISREELALIWIDMIRLVTPYSYDDEEYDEVDEEEVDENAAEGATVIFQAQTCKRDVLNSMKRRGFETKKISEKVTIAEGKSSQDMIMALLPKNEAYEQEGNIETFEDLEKALDAFAVLFSGGDDEIKKELDVVHAEYLRVMKREFGE